MESDDDDDALHLSLFVKSGKRDAKKINLTGNWKEGILVEETVKYLCTYN